MEGKRKIRIGILGFGTVGQGVWKHIKEDRAALERRLGVKLELVRAAVSDLSKKRGVKLAKSKLTDDPYAIVDDPKIDIVCELIGGTKLARKLTLRALANGKTVVTANKALICEHGDELFTAARKEGVHYFFEASVAGGIPIIKTLREGLVANRFPLIYGILNGTSNYILTRMEREGLSFEEIVGDARDLGYVEADESLDLDGWDAAHKAVILAYLAHGKWVNLDEMLVEGIRNITARDVAYASELGYKIKLLAVIARNFNDETLSVRLHPALIKKGEIMAQVDMVFNGVSLTGDVVGTTLLVGRGAGQDATASAVISDIADAVHAIQGAPGPLISEEDEDIYRQLGEGLTLAKPKSVESAYYFRLRVRDEKGVLAKVTKAFSDAGLSVATMIQHEEPSDGSAVLLFTTHVSNEAAAAKAINKLEQLDPVIEAPFLLRIFNAPEM
ncbi:homoserine dehydrogenase [Rubellicoccus peritrichatus]|uniref:Homoserine dehydrogenase n=1 Tax=Rubellicoccus peritrichatus TaxID=3080537 RepID=A0AAQ3QVN1_9BACT|nr:homoserine dehydrogenase [Puniceicoccus sp. CR14]WOO41793.1 homoserine dehydrogenase [Puniceicoccus sp. CR14]